MGALGHGLRLSKVILHLGKGVVGTAAEVWDLSPSPLRLVRIISQVIRVSPKEVSFGAVLPPKALHFLELYLCLCRRC